MCADTRRILEPGLPKRDGKTDTTGTCLYAAFLLCRTLVQFAQCDAIVCGGDGEGDGGALGMDGAWYGHYWVEGKTADGIEFAADITADQFGYPQVVVLPIAQARARYQPGAQEDVLCAVLELEAGLSAHTERKVA